MHPPLDRPHPDCEDVVQGMKRCHAENSKVFFWRCNDAKAALDKCFKKEKERMLNELTKDFQQERLNEDKLITEALGQQVSFEDYLNKDKGYQKARQDKAVSGATKADCSK